MTIPFTAKAGVVAFLVAAGTAALAGSPTSDAVDRACTADMHLSRDSLDYKSCAADLTRVQADIRQRQMLQQSRASCAAAGLAPGSRDFAECTLSNLPYRVGTVEISEN